MKSSAPILAIAVSLVIFLSGCGFFSHKSEPAPASVRTHKIVRTAYAQIGKRYRPGGASPQKGFDCSGLVWWSYRQNGVKVPRITRDQARTGRRVNKKAARPGDIVVFRTGHGPAGLHTGIYAGQNKFIHSPSSGKRVTIGNMSASYWTKKLVSIRRVGK